MPGILKKIIFAVLLLSFSFRATAPSWESIIILDSLPIEPYKLLIHAIGMVETRGDTMAYNPIEKAVGFFQIRPIRLKDYNERTGSHYTMKNMFDYKISEKIFLFFADQIGPYDFEQIAKKWNGSGKKTIHYWKQVKKYLERYPDKSSG